MSDDNWQCDACHEWNESVSHWKLSHKVACDKIAQQAKEIETKDKRIAELQEALANIRAYSGVCSQGRDLRSEIYNFANRALSNNKGEG